MHKNRTAAKVDLNQNLIVETLRMIPGVTVEPDHDDILVGYRSVTYWFEIKNPELACSKKTGEILKSAIKPDQQRILDNYTGHYKIVSSLEQILTEIGINGI